MYFTQDKHLRELKKLMQCVPNFRPRGQGVIVIEVTESSPPGYADMMNATVSAVKCPAFLWRLNQYLTESEMISMMYKNDKHRTAFETAVKKENKKDYALLAAVYLLTADFALWKCVRHAVVNNVICFEQVRLHGTNTSSYSQFCAAKDLYLGTKHLTVSDLADSELISPKTFSLICNAMAIRRFGLGAIQYEERNIQK